MPIEALGLAASQHAQSVFNFGAALVGKHKHKEKPHPPPLIFPHTLYILPCLVLLSLLWFGLVWAVPRLYRKIRACATRRQPIFLGDDDEIEPDVEVVEPLEAPAVMPSQGLWADLRSHWQSLRSHGTIIVSLDIVRTLLIAGLLALSIYAAILADGPPPDDEDTSFAPSGALEALKKKKKKKKNKPTVGDYSSLEWGEMGACVFYLYVLLLSFMVLALQRTKLRRNLTNHIDMLLAIAFGIFAYRDIWPALTYYLSPSDLNNWVTWTRIGMLFLAGIVTPLVRPRTYVPADPMNPTPPELVHPEQTASPFNFVFYNFMTDLIRKAWKVTSLPYDDLHPLADYDRASYLYGKHMHKLDPMRRQERGWRKTHLFWNLLTTFNWDFFWAAMMCALTGFFEITPTIALNRLLNYIEDEGKGAKIKPWVWIIVLFLGPTLNSMSIQYYVFIMTRCLVRAEALLTQLLFDQALRLRMRDSMEDDEITPGADVPDIQVEEAEETEQNGQSNGSANGTANGKDKKKKEVEPASTKPPSQGIIGRINVLMSQDIESLTEGRDIMLFLVYTPTSLALCMYILYKMLSWSALLGVLALLLTLPIPGWITKLSAGVQTAKMEATDARVDTVTEAIGALRIIKMFGWEDRIKARISAKREEELVLTWKRRLLNLINNVVNLILPVVTMTVSLASYTLIQKKPLDAATVFTSMSIFEMLKDLFGMTFWMVNQYITSGVSLNRLDEFLNETDVIDAFSPAAQLSFQQTPEHLAAIDDGLIRLKDATFAWGTDSENKNITNFRIHVPDATFPKGEISLITGPTGSGKSSLLKALIGELHFEPQPGAFFHLPRQGGVSYAAQESWCLSASIRDNILFGSPYDEARYRKVVHDCALETDIKMFDDGDQTEIGEKGVTLSGGQKARITLARAIYARTATVLLDDIFSALDTLTSRFIIDNLFKGELVEGRTVVLITHHVHLAAPIASYMVTLNDNGVVTHAGPIDSTCVSASSSSTDVSVQKKEAGEAKALAAPEENGKIGGTEESKNKLIKDEEKSEGRISRKALFTFFGSFGGATFWILFWSLLFASQALNALQPYWLGLWSNAYRTSSNPSDVDPVFWLGWYVMWVVLGTLSVALATVLYYQGSMRASRIVHARLVDKIFGSYLRFLDTTPVGRIISRFTKDMRQIDGGFTETALGVFTITMSMIIKFVAVVVLVPLFSIPAIVIGLIGAFIGEMYIHGQLSVKREMSNAKSPLFSHLSASINGIVSIRAYGAQEQIKRETQAKADKYTRAATAFYNLNRWVTIRIDMLGGIFSALLASFLIYLTPLAPNEAGFALQQAISFSILILWWVRMINEMEVQGNSVERIEDYLVIDQEPPSVPERKPPAAWPTSGEVVLDNLCAKYSEDGPTVLDHINVRIASGEKIGIVGRTGSGKSTMALALLRMIPTSGEVYIDGVRTDKINLHDLRSNVTIIPQDPVLLSGSLRFNLDPFGEYADSVLIDAMDASGLGQTASYADAAAAGTSTPQRITLDTLIAAGGSNLSQGQRQLVALARALVRQSKVLILDEATSSIDISLDNEVQKAIRNLPPSTTVLTIAHRLGTVMDYDKILVLGHGKVLEFDTPAALKANPDSYFAQLVEAMEH